MLSKDRRTVLGVNVEAKSGGSRSVSYLYWGWIRRIAKEEGVPLPQSGSATDSLTDAEARGLASALRARAQKIRKGIAPRDASSYVQQVDKEWFPREVEGEAVGTVNADFDDPDSIDDTAKFFESSGGVTLRY
jgi:hypothetical protein